LSSYLTFNKKFENHPFDYTQGMPVEQVKHSSGLRPRHQPKQGSGVRNPEPNAIHPTGLHPWHSGSWVKEI